MARWVRISGASPVIVAPLVSLSSAEAATLGPGGRR